MMPTSGSSPLRLFGQAFLGSLALQSCGFTVGGVGVQAAGGIVEVDLVFPRNETYRPGAVPILFAIQNSALAVPLTMRISWTLWEDSGNRTKMADGTRHLLCDELGQSDPFFSAESVNPAVTTDYEATWVLLWNVQSQNCTGSQKDSRVSHLTQLQQVTFTTKKGAQEPDVLQGTAACARSPGITFNVTDTVPVYAPLNEGRATCNVLASGPPPAANVCAIAIGPAVAATMTKEAPEFWCDSVTPTATSTPTTNAAAAGPGPATAAHATGLTWLAFLVSMVCVMAGLC